MTKEELDTLNRLHGKLFHDDREFRRLDRYYNGQQEIEQMGLAVPPELDRFLTIVNWPRLGIGGIEHRLQPEGFRYAGDENFDKEMWRIWQANNLDGEAQLGRLDALIYGRSYMCVGTNPDDRMTPIVTVESPREVIHEYDQLGRKASCAGRFYKDTDEIRRATLYLPEATVWLVMGPLGWEEENRDDHGLGVVPVIPMINQARVADRHGVSEMQDLIMLTDAAARTLTNLQLAQETLAAPRRGVIGATAGDFVDKDGNVLPAWEAYFGTLWALKNENAKTFQFEGADLSNFHNTVEHYARQASAVMGLPPSYFGLAADDAASADAIRSREAELNKRCERKIDSMSDCYEEMQRVAIRFKGRQVPKKALSLEMQWRDPSTPTKAQAADAALKLTQGLRPVIPVEMAQEEYLGWGPTKRERAKQMFIEQNSDPLLESFVQTRGDGRSPVPSPESVTAGAAGG